MNNYEYSCVVFYDKKDIQVKHTTTIEPVLSMGAECIYHDPDDGLLLSPKQSIEYPLGYSFYTEDEDPFSCDHSLYQIYFYQNRRKLYSHILIDHNIKHDLVNGDSITITNISQRYVWINKEWSMGYVVVEPIAFISFVDRKVDQII